MGTTKTVLQSQLDALKKWADDTESAVTGLKPFQDMKPNDEVPEVSPIWDALTAQAKDSRFQKFLEMSGLNRRLLPPDNAALSAIPFDDFLQRMSKTVVTAQRQLDAESGQYLAEVAADQKKSHVMPSVFRLPKLSAQMKFSLDVQQSQSLNLIFFRHDGSETSRNEQSIDFDIVSIPAPPDAPAAVRAIGPRLDLVLDPLDRGRVLDAIRATPTASGLEPILEAAQDSPEQVLLLGLMREDGLQRYLVLFADSSPDADEHAVGMWLAAFPDDGPPALETVYRLTRKNGQSEGHLKDVVLAVAARQVEFFAG
jgi:hypothetical protein